VAVGIPTGAAEINHSRQAASHYIQAGGRGRALRVRESVRGEREHTEARPSLVGPEPRLWVLGRARRVSARAGEVACRCPAGAVERTRCRQWYVFCSFLLHGTICAASNGDMRHASTRIALSSLSSLRLLIFILIDFIGEIEVWLDGTSVIRADGLQLRESAECVVKGLHMQTFYGGAH
jgi:hypothetical protein